MLKSHPMRFFLVLAAILAFPSVSFAGGDANAGAIADEGASGGDVSIAQNGGCAITARFVKRWDATTRRMVGKCVSCTTKSYTYVPSNGAGAAGSYCNGPAAYGNTSITAPASAASTGGGDVAFQTSGDGSP